MTRKLYCCATDWLHEVGEAPDFEGRMPFFSSVEKLKAAKPCWKSCGIVEIGTKLGHGANMNCFVVIFDGEGFEPVNKKVYLNYDDAKKCLDEVVDEHEMLCVEGKWTSYAHRYEVVEFELVGELK